MATVEKDIKEESEKISKVKKLVKKRAEELEDRVLVQTSLSEGTSWKELSFQYPERKFYWFTATLICFEYCL